MRAAVYSAKLYSLGLNAATAIYAASAVGHGTVASPAMIAMAGAIISWLYFNWVSDAIQQEKAKPKVNVGWLLLLLFVAGLLRPAPIPLAMLALYALTIALYALKSTVAWLGPLGPVLRAATVVALCLWTAALADPSQFPSGLLDIRLVFIALLNARRNYIGDVRDMRTDKYELPARIGIVRALGIAAVLSLVLAAVAMLALPPLFAAGVILADSLMMWYLYRRLRKLPYAAHKSHHGLVITDTTNTAALAWHLGASLWFSLICILLALTLSFTYRKVPGKHEYRLSPRLPE